MDALAVVVLAAGLGKRMGLEELPKVLSKAYGTPLLSYVLGSAAALKPQQVVIVTGHKREPVEDLVRENILQGEYALNHLGFAVQKEQRGTGDAARAALPVLKDFSGTVLILYGDTPLIRSETLKSLLSLHHNSKATLSLLSVKMNDPGSYGRVVRSADGSRVEKIVEAKDCSPEELALSEINSGIYAVDSAFLAPALESLKNDNAQKEYYLTDIVAKAAKEGQTVSVLMSYDPEEMLGVNTLLDLNLVNRVLLSKRLQNMIESGVQIPNPDSVFIDPAVQIAPGAFIGPQTQLFGKTSVAPGVVIEGCAFVKNCAIEEGALLKLAVRLEESTVGKNAMVGPFAHLRPGSHLGEKAKVGNFVETKKATLAHGAKASHLTYLGDCTVGENANIGAGTITCNYDGANKFETTIGKEAFIGSNTSLVAPVVIGERVTIGAGSVITKDIDPDSLALTRAPLTVKPGWVRKKKG